MAHLAVPAKLLESFGLNSIRDGLGAQKIRLAHGDQEGHNAEAVGSGTGSSRGKAGPKLTAGNGAGEGRVLAASELTRLSETEDARDVGGCAGGPCARAVGPVCPTFKVPPCSRGRVLSGCRPAPCNRNGMSASGGMRGSGCCKAGGMGLHAHPRLRKAPTSAGPHRAAGKSAELEGRVPSPGWGQREQGHGLVPGDWDGHPGPQDPDGSRLSVGATRLSISLVLPLRTREHAVQSL